MLTLAQERFISAAPIECVDPRLPDNSELRKIARDALNAAKYAFAVTAAHPTHVPRGDTLEAAFAESLASMKEERRAQYQETARRLLAAEEWQRSRIFGRFAALDPDRMRRVGFHGLPETLGLLTLDRKLLGLPAHDRPQIARDLDRLEAVWGPITSMPRGPIVSTDTLGPLRTLSAQPDSSVAFPGYYRKLEFKLKWLRCIDETNPEWTGSDEIAIGAIAVHTTGKTTKAGPNTYEEFDDGNTEWFSPHWTVGSFERPAPKSGEWLYDTYAVMIALAEVDSGGFGKFLDKIYEHTKKYILTLVAASIAAGLVPFVGPYVGVMAGIVAAWVTNELIEWFIVSFADDPFPLKSATITAPRGFTLFSPADWVFEGTSVRSKDNDLHFYGHGGHYTVRYYWRFSDWVAGSGPQ